MNITSIGGAYELVNDQSIMEKMKEEIELFKKLPIQLSDEDNIRIKTNKLLSNILSNLNDPYLISCIMSTNPKLKISEKQSKRVSQNVQKLVLRPETNSGKISLKNVSLSSRLKLEAIIPHLSKMSDRTTLPSGLPNTILYFMSKSG